MKTTYNQELVATILSDNISNELQTIQDFLRWTYSTFNRSDIYYGQGHNNAWEESLQLVLAGLQLPVDLPTELFQSRLTASEKENLVQLVLSRIEQRVPVAYLTNSAWFCGHEFYVDERTIIPRSPISALIQNRFENLIEQSPRNILDLCTGSGCIAVACAYAFPEAEIDAIDLSFDALNVAEINITRHQLEHRVFPIQSNLFENILGQKYDLIVTNPPYVDEEDLADMPEEFHFEPELALGSGHDGLDITKQILKQAPNYLTENGVLVCEVGNSMVSLIEQYPDVPFNWVELKNGGVGVFAINRKDLVKYQGLF
ncbi:50S ribosomal protein L3 N(5)-glutamine methyltransferase [Rodentibacter abscessus]|uniref:50S ribosomal protein L3 N(5)-glutamine methyltransferase n=1 Tax=Rodentibacter abscessus TaxID=3381777 RepID=UPI00399CCFB5